MLSTSLLIVALAAAAQAVNVNVGSTGGNKTSPYQYGLMFEDINNSGDGGVYAELISNRAFQGSSIFPSTLAGWYSIGGANLAMKNLSKPLSSALPTSMHVTAGKGHADQIGFWNEGYWGFPVVQSWQYNGSFYIHGDFKGDITVCLDSNTTGKTYATTSVKVNSQKGQWTQYSYKLHPSMNGVDSNNTLKFTMDAADIGSPLDFNLLSLFPPTYKNRPNGNRIDLMEAMADLKPSFFRAPGGNNVEGNAAPYWWNWTQTIGPVVDRPGFPGTWGYENTNGLGLMEYMDWAEDLGMDIVLGIWSGLYLDGYSVPKNELQPYIQSALDELEFLTGDVSTTWGAMRAKYGHPEPYVVKFVEIGNEDSLSNGKTTYADYRFPMFYKALHKAYPDITLISSFFDVDGNTPPFEAAGDFHEYAIPEQMADQFTYFDNYTAEHPLLLGEYAVIEYNHPYLSGPTWNTGSLRAYFPFWYGSVAEAIYLLGAERNSDHIIGASYAPGFMNLNKWEWIPDSIEYDANPANTILSTSYYMIKLLSGTRIAENMPLSNAKFGPAYYVAGTGASGSNIFKAAVYNATTNMVPFNVKFAGVKKGATATLTYITAPFNASSTIGHNVVETHTKSLTAGPKGGFNFELPNYSVAVMEAAAAPAGYGYSSQ